MAGLKQAEVVKLDTLSDVNDIGKPWRYEEDGNTVTRLAPWSAPGCHPVGCGLKITTDANGKVINVEGDENHPVTQGRLCPRCITLRDYMYNPSRVLYPMVRDKDQRGNADAWKRISWEEAIDTIEANYKNTVQNYGREACVSYIGTGREGGTFPYTNMMLCTPNNAGTLSGDCCYIPRLMAGNFLIGSAYPEIDTAIGLAKRYDDPAYELPEVCIIWGKEPLASNADGFWGHAIIDMMRRGTRIIVVDPRLNWLANRADIHLRLRAGTDTALAMAMAREIIDEGLYNEDFVKYWCYGFDEYNARLHDPEKGYTVEQAAEICGIDPDDIRKAARMFGSAHPASICYGLAIDQKTNGMQAAQAIIYLMAITGNVDVPGGNLLGDASSGLNEVGFRYEQACGDLFPKTIGLADFPVYCGLLKSSHPETTLGFMEGKGAYPVKFGFLAGTNPISCMAEQPQQWNEAFKSLDFCFALEAFMTPSVESFCDLVLPLAASAERDGTTFFHYGAANGIKSFSQRATRTGEAKTDFETCFEVGRRLNPQMYEDIPTVDEFINQLRLSGKYDFRTEAPKVYTQDPVDYYKYEKGMVRADGKPGFNTPTGRIELYSTMYEQFGDDPLPYYEEPKHSPVSEPELSKEFPFVLTTGARTYVFFHSENRQIPYLREVNPDPIVEINPKVAKELGIADGQWVEIYNQFGSCKQKAKLTITVDEKTIHCQHAWWFPELDANGPEPYETFRSNVNNLIPNWEFGKLGFGAPLKCVTCNIRPLKENYDTDMNLVWEKFKREDQ